MIANFCLFANKKQPFLLTVLKICSKTQLLLFEQIFLIATLAHYFFNIKLVISPISEKISLFAHPLIDQNIHTQVKKHPQSQCQEKRFPAHALFDQKTNYDKNCHIFPTMQKIKNFAISQIIISIGKIFQVEIKGKGHDIIKKMIQVNQKSTSNCSRKSNKRLAPFFPNNKSSQKSKQKMYCQMQS